MEHGSIPDFFRFLSSDRDLHSRRVRPAQARVSDRSPLAPPAGTLAALRNGFITAR
jgi:hypothetical protein